MPALASLLDEPGLPADEAVLRRALNANLRLGTEVSARRLLRFGADPSRSESMRIEALECLGSWDTTPYIDRVEGLVRPLSSRLAKLGDRLIQEQLAKLLGAASRPLAQVITRIVMQNHIEADSALFTGWVHSAQQPPAIRAQALELLAERGSEGLAQTLQFALETEEPELRLTAMKLVAARTPAAFLDFVKRQNDRLTLPEKQTALRLVGQSKAEEASAFLSRNLDALLAGKLDTRLALDVLEACRGRAEATLQAKLASYGSKLDGADALAKFRPALDGGDPVAGREIFRSQPNAQCIRCHEAGGEGYQAGPVLAGIAARVTPEYLLESLIEPSKRIAEGFATVSVATRDGEVLDGTKLRDTGQELTLRLSSGEIRKIPHQEIERQSISSVSAMPPMGEVLSLFEIRDLVAYLGTLK